MRRLFVVMGWMLVTALALGSCDVGKKPEPPLRLSVVTWVGFAPFYAAKELQLYRPPGVEITSFGSVFDANLAFTQKHTDIFLVTLFEALRLVDQGVDLKIVMAADYSKGADGIAARTGIANVRDLQGKRVAVEVGTIAQYTLARALDRAGLKETEVTLVNMPVEQGVSALQENKVDAAVLWEPFLSKVCTGGVTRIFTSAEIPGEIIDLVVGHKDIIEKRPDDIGAMLNSWEKALNMWKAQPQTVEPHMMKHLGMSSEELRTSLGQVELLSLDQNGRLFDPTNKQQSVWMTYELMAKFMTERKLLKNPPRDPHTLFDPQFLSKAAALP